MARVSFQFKIYSFIFLVLFLSISLTTTMVLYNINLHEKINETGKILQSRDVDTEAVKMREIESGIRRFNFIAIVSGSIIGLLAFFILIGFRGKSLKEYEKILDRLKRSSSNFSLNIKFPSEDTLGNLGTILNRLILELQTFDKIKQQKYLLERVKVKEIIELFQEPVYILDSRLEADVFNAAFEDTFDVELKTLDPDDFAPLVTHVQRSSDIYSKSVRNEKFKEKINVKDFEFQVEFKTIPVLLSGEEKKLFSVIFLFTSVKKSSKKKNG